MGNACLSSRSHSLHSKQPYQKFQPIQIELLKQIFKDLAERSPKKVISKETFLRFFHEKGFWGDYVFRKISNGDDVLTLQAFIVGIEKLFKIDQQKQFFLIFKYLKQTEENDDPGISFKSFVSILYSYPKNDLEKVLNDPLFIKCYIKKFETEKLELPDSHRNQYQSVSINSIQIKERQQKQIPASLDIQISSSESEQKIPSMFGFKEIVQQIKQRKASHQFLCEYGDKPIQIMTNNFNRLVKKFAIKIFEENGLNPKIDRLGQKQFICFLKDHKNLFNIFYDGFHQYIWENKGKGATLPRYLEQRHENQSTAFLNEKKIYLFLIKNTLIITKYESQQKPLQIVNLQGLRIDECTSHGNYGIEISHKDSHYTQKKIFFENKLCRDKWMKFLKNFKGVNIESQYSFGQAIGAGSFSVVYEGRQLSTGKQCAIKEIKNAKINENDYQMILRESQIMSLFDNPYLIKHLQTISTKQNTYVITELAPGIDLYQYISRLKEGLNQKKAAHMARQILMGTIEIHKKGYIHRDLKPENIVVNQKEDSLNIKIIDFGFSISKQQCNFRNYDEHCYSPICCSAYYAAPQILHANFLSTKADSFSIGVIIYYMLTRSVPYSGKQFSVNAFLSNGLHFNDKEWNSISATAKNLIQKLTDFELDQRIQISEALTHEWFRITHQNNNS